MWAREACEIRPSPANAVETDRHPNIAAAKASFFIIASTSIAEMLKPETGKRSINSHHSSSKRKPRQRPNHLVHDKRKGLDIGC